MEPDKEKFPHKTLIGELAWSEKFVSGNKAIDKEHKAIIEGVVELYKMLEDTSKYKDEIPVFTMKIEEALIEHMATEIDYLKKLGFPEWAEHEANHNLYKERLAYYKEYSTSGIINAVIAGEICLDYMRDHFFSYDIEAIEFIKNNGDFKH